MSVQTEIDNRLNAFFKGALIKVENRSYLHRGHAGDDGSGESHFKITVVSDRFKEMKLIDRHKLIYSLLTEELMKKIHALEIVTLLQKNDNDNDSH